MTHRSRSGSHPLSTERIRQCHQVWNELPWQQFFLYSRSNISRYGTSVSVVADIRGPTWPRRKVQECRSKSWVKLHNCAFSTGVQSFEFVFSPRVSEAPLSHRKQQQGGFSGPLWNPVDEECSSMVNAHTSRQRGWRPTSSTLSVH